VGGSRLQSLRPVRRVAELGLFAITTMENFTYLWRTDGFMESWSRGSEILAVLAALRAKVMGGLDLKPRVGIEDSANPGLKDSTPLVLWVT
jgi:hypothetical protein